MHLTLVAPDLLAQDPALLAAHPLLARFAAIAEATRAPDLDTALLRALDLDAAPAPLAALGAGVDVGARWAIRADPVTMLASHEDVRIEALVDDLEAGEIGALLARLAGHFAGDGLVFAAPRADAWFALSETHHAIRTTPLAQALGRPLRDRLPEGDDAPRWRRWLTESQMLMHEHPLAERAAKPVTGFWFSGGGVLPERSRLPSVQAQAFPGRAGDVARGLALHAGSNAASPSPFDESAIPATPGVRQIIVLKPVRSSAGIDEAARDFLEPALIALDRGALRELQLCADRSDAAAVWKAKRPALLGRVFRRSVPFTLPSADA